MIPELSPVPPTTQTAVSFTATSVAPSYPGNGISAVTANVSALRNQLGPGNADSVLQRAYIECAQDNPRLPKADGIVPPLLERVLPVHEVVPVECFLPGCPPPADHIQAFLAQVLAGQSPKLEGTQLKFG